METHLFLAAFTTACRGEHSDLLYKQDTETEYSYDTYREFIPMN